MELKLGSIPVRIHGWFLMMALMLGANEKNPVKIALWVAVVLVSVVIHELGHAMVGKLFGLIPSIDLHGMGGTTSFVREIVPGRPARGELGAARNIAISLAGPFAGFLFAAALIGVQRAGVLQPTHPLAVHALSLVFAVNVGWGIFNLLPMLPLDGGNVLRQVLLSVTRSKGDLVARVISIAIAAGIAVFALSRDQWWILYLGALFAYQNVQAIRAARRAPSE